MTFTMLEEYLFVLSFTNFYTVSYRRIFCRKKKKGLDLCSSFFLGGLLSNFYATNTNVFPPPITIIVLQYRNHFTDLRHFFQLINSALIVWKETAV